MDAWQYVVSIGVPIASALIAIGARLAPAAPPAPRETRLPPEPPPPAPMHLSGPGGLERDLAGLAARVTGLEDRERERDDAAAEYRGEFRAGLARIFERLRIRKEERHGGDRGSEG